MSPTYEVEIHETRPKRWRVIAADLVEAGVKAVRGEGEDVTGLPYVEGEIVAIREEGKS